MAPAGGEHGWLASNLNVSLGVHVKAHQLGKVFTAETGFVVSRNPDTVRAPDCAFISKDRVPHPIPKKFVDTIPDLVVEVVSPDDSAEDVSEKVSEWLRAGVRLVWVVYPRSRTVVVHRSAKDVQILYEDDLLAGGEVVRGFELRVSEIFEG